MESLNEKIKRLRKQKGISQVDVANSSGINQSSYASIEKGETKSISIEVGKGIAKALKVDFNKLFDIEEDTQIIEDLNSEISQLKSRIIELEDQLKYTKLIVDLIFSKEYLEAMNVKFDSEKDIFTGIVSLIEKNKKSWKKNSNKD